MSAALREIISPVVIRTSQTQLFWLSSILSKVNLINSKYLLTFHFINDTVQEKIMTTKFTAKSLFIYALVNKDETRQLRDTK